MRSQFKDAENKLSKLDKQLKVGSTEEILSRDKSSWLEVPQLRDKDHAQGDVVRRCVDRHLRLRLLHVLLHGTVYGCYHCDYH